jgi:MFS family permease
MDQVLNERTAEAGRTETSSVNPIIFSLFFLSGFCSLLYQVIWIRMAFAHFGVITPVLSVALSVFMAGLGIGSVLGGRWAEWSNQRLGISTAYLYGGAEFLIGIGAFMVPVLLQLGEDYLLEAGEASSAGYLFFSAIFIVAALLPWCIMMGATLPLMISFIRQIDPSRQSGFSFLYLANVVGAMSGAGMTALVLVELFGFRETCIIAATVNFSIAAIACTLAWFYPPGRGQLAALRAPTHAVAPVARPSTRWFEVVLFTTGFTSLAMEVVWTRAFTLVLKTTISRVTSSPPC